MVALLGDTINSLADATVALCQSPRILKQALRRCDEAWSVLHGEVDLDELICFSVLREALPDAFSLVDKSVDSLRRIESRVRPKEPSSMQAFLDELGKLGLAPRQVEATKVVVQKVFGRSKRLQSVGWSVLHTDYWRRLLATPTLTDAERDQRVLKALPDDHKVIEMLERESDAQAAVHFGALIDASRLPGLLPIVTGRRVAEDPSSWGDSLSRVPGIVSLWDLCCGAQRTGTLDSMKIEDAVRKAMRIAAPNLALLQSLEYWFTTTGSNIPDIVTPAQRVSLQAECRAILFTYADRPAALAKALRGAKDYILLSICFGSEQVRQNATIAPPFDGWDEFAETLLLATIDEPNTMLPQLAVLVTSEARGRIEKRTIELDVRKCFSLFKPVGVLLDVLLDVPATLAGNENVQAAKVGACALRDAQDALMERLRERSSGASSSSS